MDLDREHQNFVDYWTAKTGSGATKIDWIRTWHTWMRRASDRTKPWERVAIQQARVAAAGGPRADYDGDPDDVEAYAAWARGEAV